MSIIIPTNITSVFFWGEFFAIFDIKSNDFSTLIFFKKISLISQVLNIYTTITKFLEWVLACSQNTKGFLIFFFFSVWSIAKFGYLLLWLITSLATSQKIEKQNPNTTPIMNY
jgi:hypothetical protein